MGRAGEPFLIIEMGIFAFCTVIGWYFCGESAYKYIFKNNKMFSLIFSAVSSAGVLIGMKEIWELSDIFNGLTQYMRPDNFIR